MAKRIDVAALPSIVGTTYPSPFDEPCRSRSRQRVGDAAGLTQYGVNLLRLTPGSVIGTSPRTSSFMSSRERSCW
jgi:uncharacterized cupin superfamily protein